MVGYRISFPKVYKFGVRALISGVPRQIKKKIPLQITSFIKLSFWSKNDLNIWKN